MRATIPQLRQLRDEDPVLYNYAVHPIATLPEPGVAEIDLGLIKDDAHKKLLVDWARGAGIQIHDAEYSGCGCTDCLNKRIADHAQTESQRAATQKRLAQYFQAGLLDSPFNGKQLGKFLDEKFPNLKVVTPQHIDAFIAAKRNELQWAPKPVAPAPPPPPPKVYLADGSEQKSLDEQPDNSWTLAQVRDWSKRDRAEKNPPAQQPLVLCSDGKPQLPLDADNQVMFKASVAQLQDLSRRRGEGNNTWGKRLAEVRR